LWTNFTISPANEEVQRIKILLYRIVSNVLPLLSFLEHPFLFKKKGYLDIVKRCFNKDTVPEIMAALENEFDPWAHEVLKTMQENCPLRYAIPPFLSSESDSIPYRSYPAWLLL